jgi:hypothetical protein
MLTGALRHGAAAGRAAARSTGRAERKMSGASVEEEVKEMNKWRVRRSRACARWSPRAANPVCARPLPSPLNPAPAPAPQVITYAAIPVCFGESRCAIPRPPARPPARPPPARPPRPTRRPPSRSAGVAVYDLSQAHPHDEKMPAYSYLHIRNKEFPVSSAAPLVGQSKQKTSWKPTNHPTIQPLTNYRPLPKIKFQWGPNGLWEGEKKHH